MKYFYHVSPKKRKGSKKQSTNPQGRSGKTQTPFLRWQEAIGFGLLGSVIFYFAHHAVADEQLISANQFRFGMMLSILISVGASAEFFKTNARKIALWSLPAVLAAVFVNIAVTYTWIDPSPTLSFLAGTLVIPIGILWLFILRQEASTDQEASGDPPFRLREVFTSPLTKIVALLILLLSGFLIFYQLGYFDIWEDENLVINAAIGVTEDGLSYFDEGYSRARVHTLMIAGLFELFGDSEFIGRLPSAIFGIVFVVLCFVIFTRWFGFAWLAILLPLICMMNDRFLLLFRYMRMYALLIPLFLAGTYIIYRTIEAFRKPSSNDDDKRDTLKKYGLVLLSIFFLILLAHIHKLSMILLPVFGLYFLYRAGVNRTKSELRLLAAFSGIVIILLILTFAVELEALKMFRQVSRRIFAPHNAMTEYYQYMLNNGLPRNATLMFLIAGIGLLFSKISSRLKSLLVIHYLLIVLALVSMIYLVGNSGRDYRYIAHIVPFVISALMLTVYFTGKIIGKKAYPWGMVSILLISGLHLQHDYKRNYVRHPWSPRYSVVYNTLLSNFQPGDALIVQNVKTYYLDPEALAGDKYLKLSKKEKYTLPQFKDDVRRLGHGWVMYELHKSHHWDIEIRKYIYKKFKPYHNGNLDELGVELFYFDESMTGKNKSDQ